MGSRAGTFVLCLSLAATAPAQVRRVADARATVNLDAIARREAAHGSRPHARRVPRPRVTQRKAGSHASSLGAERPATADPEPAYTIYSGFPALLDTYRTAPPDTGGAVGPNHVVTMLNAQVQIQSRAGEVRAGYPIDLNSFWSALGNFTDTYDPRIQYDAAEDRWIATAGVNPGTAKAALLIGASQTGDPGAGWSMFRIDVGATGYWADYPVLAFNANWVVLSANIFRLPPLGAYERTDVYVFGKPDLYGGGAGQYLTFSDDQGAFSPARDSDNSSPGTLYFLQAFTGDTATIRVSTLTGPPGAEQFTAGAGEIPVQDSWAESSPNDYDFAPQFGSWARVDTGDSRLQNCVMRAGAVWCVHTVFLPAGKPNRAAVQWFQVDPAAYRLVQLGRIEDPAGGVFYAFPSVAVNKNNEVLIGYTRFTTDGYPGAAFTLRAASDSPDAPGRRTVFKQGEAPYIAIGYDEGSNRWGDFSATVVDPADDVAFWTIQEYAAAPTQGYLGRWGTWWARIVPPSAALDCSYSVSPAAQSFDSAGGTGTLTVTTGLGCPWMAASDSGWLTVTAGSPGTGPGTVSFAAAPNPGGAALNGAITLAGQSVRVTQLGATR